MKEIIAKIQDEIDKRKSQFDLEIDEKKKWELRGYIIGLNWALKLFE